MALLMFIQEHQGAGKLIQGCRPDRTVMERLAIYPSVFHSKYCMKFCGVLFMKNDEQQRCVGMSDDMSMYVCRDNTLSSC